MNSQITKKRKANWKKIVGWSVVGLLVLIVALVGTAIFLVEHNSGFRRRILAKVESSVQESTGARLEVRDFHIHLSDLSLDLYGIKVHGTESDPDRPLLATDHVNVGIKILSFLHSKWRLQDIVIDHPVLRVSVDQAGDNNLPKPKQKSSGNTNLFDLAIQKFVLDRGEIYYNDKKSALDAELRDVNVNAGFDNAQTRYFGDLGYRQGRIQYGTYAPLVHDLQARFEATPTRFTLDQLQLATGGSRFSLKATVDDYSNNPRMQASYDALLVGEDFRRLLKNPSVPSGMIRLDGSLNYQSDPDRPMLETVSLSGNMSSQELMVKTPSVHAQVQDLGAHYTLEGGNAEVENLHAQLLGGRLEGKLVIRDVSGASRARLQASLKNIALQDVAAASGNQSSLRRAELSGRFNADAEATWAKTLDNLVAHSDATIQAAMGRAGASTPLNGVIHADYLNAKKQLALKESYIKTPQTSIALDGTVSDRSELQVRMQSGNLHELELLAANFSKPAPGEAQQAMDLYGTAVLTASVKGSTSRPQITGQLVANNLQVKGSSWKVLRTNLSASPSQLHLSNGDLEAATRGRITFDAQANLKNWAYTPSSPIAAQVSASQLSLADLERLAGKTYPVAGTLTVNVSLRGSQLNPVGHGDINLVNAKVGAEPVQSVSLQFQGNGDAIDANLNIKLPAGTTQAKATYHPKTQAYQVQLQTANLRLEKLQTVRARNLPVNGGVSLNASGNGTLQSPELTATLQIPTLQVQKQTIKGVVFNTRVHDQTAELSLNSDVAETYVKANGAVGIAAPYMVNLRLDTGRIPFEPLLAMYMPAQSGNLGGETELHASIRGPLQDKSKLEAHLEIPVLAANYKDVKLAAGKPIRLDYQNGVATLQPTAIQGTGTDIQMQGRVPVATPKEASFTVLGTVDLRLAQMIQPDIQSSGQLRFDINSSKFGAGSNVQGEIRLVNGNVQSSTAPIGISNANGTITVTRERMDVSSFQAQVGGGTITLKGGVSYRPAIQFGLALNANNVRLRYPDGVRAVLGSNLSLTGSTQAGLLSGQVRIEQVSFTNDFDLSSFMDQFNGESSPPPTQGISQNIKLNISVQSTSQMNLTSSQVSLQGSANLRVVGTAADPVIMGRANLTGGDMFLANNRYVIQSGTVDFLNPIETQPVVNLRVNTLVDQYTITLHFEGPVERLVTNYTSEPPLPPVDIINLLAFGKTTEAAAANPSPTGVAGGEALVAQGVSSQVGSKIAKLAGISNLSIDPTLGGGSNTSNTGVRIAIQQRVTGNLYVTFATDVTSTQQQEIKVEYKLNPRWSLSGVRDQNGGFGVDAKYRKSF